MWRGPYKLKVKPKTILGERLAIIIEEHKLTQKQIAEAIGVYPNAIYRWLTKYEYPNATSIMMICKTYKVSADWLLGLSNRKERW